MTDPIVRVFREAARHGTDELGEGMMARQVSEWLGADGRAAFEAARKAGTIVPAGGTDAYGDRTWRLNGVLTALASRVELLSLRARVRALDRALAAGKFRPRPGMRYDEKAGGYWVTVNGSPVLLNEGDDVGEKLAERRSEGGSGSGSGGSPKKNRPAGSGDPDEGMLRRRHAGGKRALARSPLPGATWSHRTGGTLMTVKDAQTIRKFAAAYSIDNEPVYIIATTNNAGPFNRSTENEYVRLGTEGHEAVMGKWVNKDGIEYNDISMVKSGIGVEEALRFKKEYNQDEILRLDLNGDYEFI